MRNSARAIVISKENSKEIYLIYRNKNGVEYFVTPGGGIEDGESSEQAVVREIMEELGVEIDINKLKLLDAENNSYLFLATEINKFQPTGPEMKNTNPNNYYEVQLHKIKNVKNLNLKPEYYKDIIGKLYSIKQ